jgi:hypothetical protein
MTTMKGTVSWTVNIKREMSLAESISVMFRGRPPQSTLLNKSRLVVGSALKILKGNYSYPFILRGNIFLNLGGTTVITLVP